MSTRTWHPWRTLLITVAALPFIYPFLFLVGTGLKPLEEYETNQAGLPRAFTLDNLRDAWSDANLGQAALNSTITVTMAVALTLTISTLGAFWFLRHQGRLATMLRWGLITTMAIPLPVFVIPLFLQLSDWRLTDNLVAMAFVYAGWISSFGLYLVFAYFKGLPPEVLEAASIDGATLWQQLRHVIVPLSRPVIVTLAVFTFIWAWSDLFAAVILVQDPEKRLLIPATSSLADEHMTNIPRNAAGVMIAMVPMFVVFLVGQRALVRGILSGVGK